ncbi:MAG: hypothetical protein WD800_03175, partial [Dehalococcoidia bacterium]
GLVVSPRLLDRGGVAAAEPEWIVHEAAQVVEKARGWGVAGPHYLDALAWPAVQDAAGCRRSLDLLRRYREAVPYAVPLVAVANVAFGAGVEVGAALRRLYAAAAAGAGAGALILPVEDRDCLRAARLATAEAAPAGEVEGYLVMVAGAVATGRIPAPPPEGATRALAEAWRLLFDVTAEAEPPSFAF